jgi:hypothetical protein
MPLARLEYACAVAELLVSPCAVSYLAHTTCFTCRLLSALLRLSHSRQHQAQKSLSQQVQHQHGQPGIATSTTSPSASRCITSTGQPGEMPWALTSGTLLRRDRSCATEMPPSYVCHMLQAGATQAARAQVPSP